MLIYLHSKSFDYLYKSTSVLSSIQFADCSCYSLSAQQCTSNKLAAASVRYRSVYKEDLEITFANDYYTKTIRVIRLFLNYSFSISTRDRNHPADTSLSHDAKRVRGGEVDWERGSRRKLAGVSNGKRSYASDFGVIFCFQARRRRTYGFRVV